MQNVLLDVKCLAVSLTTVIEEMLSQLQKDTTLSSADKARIRRILKAMRCFVDLARHEYL